MDYLSDIGDLHKYDAVESKLLWGTHPQKPMFSIMIPTYKRLHYLKQSLGSALGQRECNDYEVVIVDNDDSAQGEILDYIRSLNSPHVIYYKNIRNIGIYGNTLRAAQLSHGEYLVLLNDDDLLHPYYLLVMLLLIKRFHYYGIIGSTPYEFSRDDFQFPALPRGIYAYRVSRKEFFFGCSVTSPGMLYPRELLYKIYNAHEELLMGDQIIQYKGLVRYGLYFVCFPIAAYRVQNNATMRNEVLLGMTTNMCKFRKQTADDDPFLKWFVRLFYKEYCNWYITSFLNFWKKRGLKRQALQLVGISEPQDNTLKSMLARTVIQRINGYYARYRGLKENHDTLVLLDRIVKASKELAGGAA